MKKSGNIIFNTLALLLLLAYIIAGAMLYTSRTEQSKCNALNISILDSTQARFVTPQTIAQLLDTTKLTPLNIPLHKVPLNQIEHTIAQQPYVKTVQAYTSLNGECVIDIEQRLPLIRVTTDQGYDFYLDSTLTVLTPCKHYAHNVRNITGNLDFSFPNTFQGQLIEKNTLKDKVFFEKLINFANNISTDDFLSSFVTQIYVDSNRDIYLVPRIGAQIIVFGSPDAPQSRILKLKKFYTQAFKNLPTNTTVINLKFKNQIITK